VLHFGCSSSLAAAYGIAVTGTFITTTILAFIVLRARSRFPRSLTGLGMAMFLTIDLAFFGANAAKIPQGGWLPLAIASVVFVLLVTWKRGRELTM
jgi:KUP system potassium uptake protein